MKSCASRSSGQKQSNSPSPSKPGKPKGTKNEQGVPGLPKARSRTINSRQKGATGEREYAQHLRDNGFAEARRDGQQGHGGCAEDPDVRNVPGLHVEVKRVEAGNPYVWLDQSIRDAGTSGRTPIVAHRRNRHDWIVVLRSSDFLKIYQSHLALQEW